MRDSHSWGFRSVGKLFRNRPCYFSLQTSPSHFRGKKVEIHKFYFSFNCAIKNISNPNYQYPRGFSFSLFPYNTNIFSHIFLMHWVRFILYGTIHITYFYIWFKFHGIPLAVSERKGLDSFGNYIEISLWYKYKLTVFGFFHLHVFYTTW